MAIDSKQSEAFLGVAETGSFEQAAERLHLTPSAVSLRVRALETALGQALIVRGRPCRATHAGRQLLQHLQRARLMEQDLLSGMAGAQDDGGGFFNAALAVNADSLATWLLPAVAQVLQRERITLELVVDDQTHTYALLEAGLVNACVSAEPHAMRGCVAEPLGHMRYRLVASPAFAAQWFRRGVTRAAAQRAPAVVFNRKDQLHADALLRTLGLPASAYPAHYVPASEPFVAAVRLGLGYGMVPVLQIGDAIERGELVDVLPDAATDVALYWHCWAQQSPRLDRLTRCVQEATLQVLRG